MNRPPARRRPVRPVLLALLLIGALALCTAATAQEKKAPAAPASKAKAGASKSKAKPDAAKPDGAKSKAAQPAPAPKTTAAAPVPADDKLILPFVGENTFLVARLDVGGIDVDALERFAMEVTEAGPQFMPGLLAARRQANAIAAQREAQRAPAAPEGDGLD